MEKDKTILGRIRIGHCIATVSTHSYLLDRSTTVCTVGTH